MSWFYANYSATDAELGRLFRSGSVVLFFFFVLHFDKIKLGLLKTRVVLEINTCNVKSCLKMQNLKLCHDDMMHSINILNYNFWDVTRKVPQLIAPPQFYTRTVYRRHPGSGPAKQRKKKDLDRKSSTATTSGSWSLL
jgi:hypothetical protein